MTIIQLVKPLVPLVAAALLAGACSPKVDAGGYVKNGEVKDKIIVGQTNREEVANKLGSPSSQSSFGEETWYYISARKETMGFLKPEVVEQDVVRITFDKAGIVSKMENFDKADSKDVKLAKRTTPTEGHTLGFVEQVLGNIGRFNKSEGPNVQAGRKPRSGSY